MVDSPPPTYEDIFTEQPGPETASREGADNWSEDELPTTQPFSGANLFSAEPDAEAPGGLIFPDLPNVGGGMDEVSGLFGAHSLSIASDVVSEARRESSSTSLVSVVDPLPY